METAKLKRFTVMNVANLQLKKQLPTNFHDNYLDLNQDNKIRIRRERAPIVAQEYLAQIKNNLDIKIE